MELDPVRCYRALASRDARFDGRFFVAVKTTGIYCRPVCPAPTPRERNVRFFACAAAAETAGFRACRRCRPETSPGTPAWLGSSAVVSRALRLIREGALDGERVEALAARVGIGARQLRRLFDRHLGASPAEVARAARTHLARRLLDETDLPMARVAVAAGFASVRQFNHAVRASFGAPPGALRRARGRTRVRPAGVVLRLAYRPPLAWEPLLAFLAARAIPGVEAVAGDTYRRTIHVGGASGSLEIGRDSERPALWLRVHLPESHELLPVVERARRIFDLGCDPAAVARHLAASPLLAPRLKKLPGLRVPGAWDGFELAVRAVLGQQVSVAAATRLAGRLVRAFGKPLEGQGPGLTHCFPAPAALADADIASIGMPRARAETLRAIARAAAEGQLFDGAALGLDAAVERLCAIPGVGPWTAHYVAMRALGEPDAFPASDLGLRRALAANARMPGERALLAAAEPWRPWRAYAAVLLWLTGAGPPAARGRERR